MNYAQWLNWLNGFPVYSWAQGFAAEVYTVLAREIDIELAARKG